MSDNVAIRFCVPSLGTKIQLAEDWKFKLYHEMRNESLWNLLNEKKFSYNWRADDPEPVSITLPKGTVLSIDRIYVRRGKSEYDSLTFNLISTTHNKLQVKGRKRFWAKLADVNSIKCFPIGSPTQKIEESVFYSFIGPGQRLLDI